MSPGVIRAALAFVLGFSLMCMWMSADAIVHGRPVVGLAEMLGQ